MNTPNSTIEIRLYRCYSEDNVRKPETIRSTGEGLDLVQADEAVRYFYYLFRENGKDDRLSPLWHVGEPVSARTLRKLFSSDEALIDAGLELVLHVPKQDGGRTLAIRHRDGAFTCLRGNTSRYVFNPKTYTSGVILPLTGECRPLTSLSL